MAFIDKCLRHAPICVALAWIAGWTLLAVLTPIDASYDVLHYHLHNGWSAFEGRLSRDLAPAGMHTYFNPVYNVLAEAWLRYLPAGAVALLLGVLQAGVLIPLYMLCRRVLISIDHDNTLSAALLALAGFCSYSMLNVTASIRNDHWIAAAFLAGLLILIPGRGQTVGWRRAALAAFVVGLSIGLKLTGVVHAAGLAAAVLVAVPGTRARIEAALAAAAAGLAGMAIGGGWWAWKLWTELGNPVFPMANGLFKSPFSPPENFRDPRSLPDSVWDVLLFPFNGPFRYNEYDISALQDLPIGLLYAALIVWAVFAGKWTAPAGEAQAALRPSRALAVVVAAILATLAVWFALFAIGRYIMSVWMLSPLVFAATLILIWPAVREPARAALWFGGVFALCAVAGNTIALRRTPITDIWAPYVRVEPPASVAFDNALVIFTGGYPTSFLAAHLPESATYTFALTAGWTEPAERELTQLVRERIIASDGPFVAVMVDMGVEEGPEAVSDMLARLEDRFGLMAETDKCAPFKTNFDNGAAHWTACPLTKRN